MMIPWSNLLKFLAGLWLCLNAFGVELFHFTTAAPGLAAMSLGFGVYMASDGAAAIIAHGWKAVTAGASAAAAPSPKPPTP